MTSWMDVLEAVPWWGQACAIAVGMGATLLVVSVPAMLAEGVPEEVLAVVAILVLGALAVLVDVVRVGLERSSEQRQADWSGE